MWRVGEPERVAGGPGGGGEPAAQCYLRLRQDVLDGAFPAGTPLQEVALSTRYGVSRTPVREALARLEQDGLLERAVRGYRVRAGTPEDVLDIYETRIVLEGMAAALAAVRHTELELARLERVYQASLATDEVGPLRRLNAEWHEVLWVASHSATVRGTLVRLTSQLRIYDQEGVEDEASVRSSRDEHDEVMVALRDHDGERARSAITTHLVRSRDLRLTTFARAADQELLDERLSG